MQEISSLLFDLAEEGAITAAIIIAVTSLIDVLVTRNRLGAFCGTISIWILIPAIIIAFFNKSVYGLLVMCIVFILIVFYFIIATIWSAIFGWWLRPIKRLFFRDCIIFVGEFKYTTILAIPGVLFVLMPLATFALSRFYLEWIVSWNIETVVAMGATGLLMFIIGVTGNIRISKKKKKQEEERQERARQEAEIQMQKDLKEKRRRDAEMNKWLNSPEKREADRKEKAEKEFRDRYERANPIVLPPISIDMNKALSDMQRRIKDNDY